MQEKNDAARPLIWIGVALALVIVAAAAVGLWLLVIRWAGALGESRESLPLDEIRAYAGVQIPPGARDLRSRLDLVVTKRTLLVRFTVAQVELSSFLRGAPFGEPLSPGQVVPAQMTLSNPPPWWTPGHGGKFLVGEARRAAIVVEIDDPERCTVYLIAES
jgi:hypothetical protein